MRPAYQRETEIVRAIKCKGYKNRTVAKVERVGKGAAGWVFHHVLKPAEMFWAAIWAWTFKQQSLESRLFETMMCGSGRWNKI